MSKKYIEIQGEKVAVTEEFYKEYYKMDRRRRYLEEDIKVGRSKRDPETGRVIFKPSKEDSYNRLMEAGEQFQANQVVEDIVCDKAVLLVLQEALKELDEEERQIITGLYYEDLTTRETGGRINKSHVTVGKKHKRILEKLKKYFIKNGYQDSPFR